jgi:Flp pilus assembly protein TadG
MSAFSPRKDHTDLARPRARLIRCIRAAVRTVLVPFARDERGAILMYVAVATIPLVAFLGIGVDTTRGYLAKSRLSSAVDAAALAGGRVFTSATRDDDVRMYFTGNFPEGYMGSALDPLVITPDSEAKTLTVSAHGTIPTSFMHLVGIDSIPLSASAQVTIASQNVEVAMVLDLTGSMVGQRTTDLIAAANQLVDIVVQDDQTLFYTKVGLVPYSQAVNVSKSDGTSYANAVRGPWGSLQITNVEKLGTSSSNRKIRVTVPDHAFQNGDKIFISDVSTTGTLDSRINNSMTGTYNSSSAPNFWVVGERTATDFILKRANGNNIDWDPSGTSSDWTGSYTTGSTGSGGVVYCMVAGCRYLAFQRDSDNDWQTWKIHDNCVTERSGANAYTDVAPSATTYVGPRYYPSGGSGNDCISSRIQPLSSDKTLLHSKINGLSAGGSTGGQIGVAWGWYLLSPNFNSVWTDAENQAAAYGTKNLLKVLILMTDGEYNSTYYNGVIAQDSTSGSGGDQYKINHNSHNGNPYTQAETLCAAMKAQGKGIIVYTVGLDIIDKQEARDLVNNCATSPNHVYLPSNGTEMQTAFQDIAQKISKLRLSQ